DGKVVMAESVWRACNHWSAAPGTATTNMTKAAPPQAASSGRPSATLWANQRPSMPEASHRILGDILQRLIQRHEHWTEVTNLIPFVAMTPPHDLDQVTLAGQTQPSNGLSRVLTEERVTFGRFLDDHPATVGFVESFDPRQDIVVSGRHGVLL